MLVYIWRKFAWACLRGLKLVLDGFESLLDAVYKLVDFGASDKIKNFISTNNKVIFAVGALCLVIFSISYMRKSKKTSLKTLIDNILLGLGVITLSVTLTFTMTKGSFNVAKAIYSGNSTTADQIFNENIYDVTTFDSFNWKSVDKVLSIEYGAESLAALDITAEVLPKNLKPENDVTKEVFNQKIEVDTEGNRELVKLSRGLFQMDENYYRYSWHPWIILFQMLAMMIVLFAASFKYTKSIYNSFYNGMIAPFFAFSDLIEASKVQKIITGLVNTSINTVLFALSLKLYRMMSAYTGTMEINAVQQVFIQLFLAFIVVEGPYIIQELTGQDGGVRSETKALGASAVGAAFLGSKAGKALKNGFDNVKDKVNKGANFVGGMGQGMLDAGKDTLEEDMKAEKESDNQATKPMLDPEKEMSQQEKEDFDNEVKAELSQDSPDTASTGSSISNLSAENELPDNPDMDMKDKGHIGMPAPPAGLEDISAMSPVLEKEMEQAKDEGTIPSIHSPLPEGSMAKANPLGKETSYAMSAVGAMTANGLSSQQAIQSALGGAQVTGSAPMAAISSLPESIQAMSGVHEIQQGGFLAPLSSPSSARMSQMLSIPRGSAGFTQSSHIAMSRGVQSSPPLNVAVPTAITSLPGVQQYRQDLANSGKPITTATLSEVIGNKFADRQIRKAEERKVYQKYNQVGYNTGKEMLEKFQPRKERSDD